MDAVSKYHFHKTKYGEELLLDVVQLKDIKKYLSKKALHSLTYFDITLITEGNGTFKIADKIYAVEKGDVLFTMPGQPREWDIENIINGYALIFEESFLLSFFNDPNFLKNISYFNTVKIHRLVLSDEEFQQTLSLIKNIQTEISEYEEKDRHILRAILYQILKYLDRIFIQKNSVISIKSKNGYIHKFIELVNLYYSQYHTVQYYADKLCITPNYLNELVKKETGHTAKQIINNKLLSKAKTLLLYSQVSVSEIAGLLNFENSSYFIRFFRKQSGLTPLQYRDNTKP
ncbi:MAG: AraC family transcriptional regulator [Dysgonomonas sp.]